VDPPRYNHPKVVPQTSASIRVHSRLMNIDGPTHKTAAANSMPTVKFYGQAERAISNGQLNVLLRFHIRPINVVVFHGPS
jgi:alpha-beta hydrolase superfamily lysophospholipase